jgi:Transglutaminase-like superfamily
MRLLRKLAKRSTWELVLFLEAFVTLAVTRIALSVLHFQTVRRGLGVLGKLGFLMGQRRADADTLLWAVKRAKSKWPFGSTCLTEALTAEAMFKQHGFNPELCIGAIRRDGHFLAHAWLENDGAVLIGGPASIVQQYIRFPDLNNKLAI